MGRCVSCLVVCVFVASDHTFKVLLLGDSGVGKSCMLLQYVVGRAMASAVRTSECLDCHERPGFEY
jgi:GTPase SAR1 family protein